MVARKRPDRETITVEGVKLIIHLGVLINPEDAQALTYEQLRDAKHKVTIALGIAYRPPVSRAEIGRLRLKHDILSELKKAAPLPPSNDTEEFPVEAAQGPT